MAFIRSHFGSRLAPKSPASFRAEAFKMASIEEILQVFQKLCVENVEKEHQKFKAHAEASTGASTGASTEASKKNVELLLEGCSHLEGLLTEIQAYYKRRAAENSKEAWAQKKIKLQKAAKVFSEKNPSGALNILQAQRDETVWSKTFKGIAEVDIAYVYEPEATSSEVKATSA